MTDALAHYGEHHAPILLALHTGARKEAILSPRWPQIDLKAGRINFAVPGRKRTKKRRPHIPIPKGLLPFLRYAQAKRSSDTGAVLNLNGRPIQRIDKGFMRLHGASASMM